MKTLQWSHSRFKDDNAVLIRSEKIFCIGGGQDYRPVDPEGKRRMMMMMMMMMSSKLQFEREVHK